MKTSETIGTIAPALVKAQAQMQAAAKSATNPHFKSKYADLATVIDAVKGPLIANGIMFMQSPTNDATGVQVTTRFQHESGEFIEDTIYLPVPQQTPQAYGSAITYGKRYGLQSLTGLPSEDDDGEKASEAAKAEMPRKEFVDHCTAMSDAAGDPEELRRVFTVAYRAAEKYGDAQAQKALTEKKDQLKAAPAKADTRSLAEQA